jgi:hypothetical protein
MVLKQQTFHQVTFIHPVSFVSHRLLLRVTDEPCRAKRRRRSIFKLESQGGIPYVFKNREYSSFEPQHFPSAKLRIAFQRHGGTHLRYRVGADRLLAMRGRRRGDLLGRRRFDWPIFVNYVAMGQPSFVPIKKSIFLSFHTITDIQC